MSILVLIAVYVIGWLILYFYPGLRALALGLGGPAVLTDGEGNLACLRVPRGWRRARGLNEQPAIEVVDVSQHSYLTIASYSKEDLDPELDLKGFALMMHEYLPSAGRIVAMRGPDRSCVGDYAAVVYEIDLLCEHFVFRYLHVAIDGRRARHDVWAWTTRSRFNRQRFEEVLAGFSEMPGPDPEIPILPIVPVAEASASRYEVH